MATSGTSGPLTGISQVSSVYPDKFYSATKVNQGVMQIEVITKEDLQVLRQQMLGDIKELLSANGNAAEKEWLRSSDVRKLLKISPGTLQNLRITGQLCPTKVNGIYFYKYAEVMKMLDPEISKYHKNSKKWI
jgi:hypothetical protein